MDIWHNRFDVPEKGRDILAYYKNYPYCNFVIVRHDGQFWFQHLPPMHPIFPRGGWVGIDESGIQKWAYIDELTK